MELMLLLYEVLLFLVVIFGNIELHHSCTMRMGLFSKPAWDEITGGSQQRQ
jgi:hypothetical protein